MKTLIALSVVASMSPADDGYTDVDSAAKAALSTITERSSEMCGGIWKLGDRYHFTMPEGQGERTACAVYRGIRDATLVAIYHTHAALEHTGVEFFSCRDIKEAKKLKVSTYMRLADTDVVRKYVPNETRTITLRVNGERCQYALGEVVL